MLDRGVEYVIKNQAQGNFQFPFLNIIDDIKDADLLIGNLESLISDKGTKVGSIYSFRADPKAIEGLVFCGFDVLTLAHNHAFDYTRLALEDTFKRLKEAGIDYVGAGFNSKEAFAPLIKEVKGKKIAFFSYTNLGPNNWKAKEDASGIAWISNEDIEKVKQDIEDAKKEADFVIVFLHAGEEYQLQPNIFQNDLAKASIDAGADLVIGHHPHVAQASEEYNGKMIFYSLGNFIFDQDFSEETMKGIIVKAVLEIPRDKNQKGLEVKEIKSIDIKINSSFQPEIDSLD